jgi:hypothetical protein
MFLNFVNFYRRFIYWYSKRVTFLTSLLKENRSNKKFDFFVWSNKVEQAFRQLCDIFMLVLLLCYYNLSKKIKIKIDASNFTIASILS